MSDQMTETRAWPRIPMIRRAEIREHDGWWFRYVVHRTHGIFILENSTSCHRTLKGARRAADRWCRRKDRGGLVEARP